MRPIPFDPRDQEHLESPEHDHRPTSTGPAPMRRRTRDAGRAMLGALFVLLIVFVLIALL
jgi:hypothetical protein